MPSRFRPRPVRRAATLRDVSRYGRAALWLICLSPLVWIPGGFDRFVLGKVLVATAGIGCAALAARRGRLPRPVAVVAVAGLVWFTLACLLSPTPWASFVGRWPRYEGVPVLLVYAGCLWAGARLLGGRGHAEQKELTTALSTASVVLGAASLLSALGWSIEGDSVEERTGSLLGNATDQGMVAMMFAAVLFAPWLTRRTPLLTAGLGAAALTLVLSGSRASLLATLLVILAVVVLKRRTSIQRAHLVAAGAAVTVLVALVLALPQTRDRLTSTHSVEGRLLLWRKSLAIGADRWWSGGPSTFVDTFGRHKDAEWVRVVGVDNPPDSPHSWLLQALVAGGVPLLLLALAAAVLVLRSGWFAHRREATDPVVLGALAATVGYGVALLPNFTIAGSTCLAAFLAGVLVADEAPPRERAVQPRLAAATAAAGLVVFGLAAVAENAVADGVESVLDHDVEAAEAAFDRARILRPWDADTSMLAAQTMAAPAYERFGDAPALTETHARRSLAATPDTFHAGLALAVALHGQGDLAGAHATLDRLLALHPVEPLALIERARVRFEQTDVAGARADLRLARRLSPGDPVPRLLLREIDSRVGSGRG